MDIFFARRRTLFRTVVRSNALPRRLSEERPQTLPPWDFSRRASAPPAGRSAQHGFTLIELLVVLVILSVLATVVGPKLFGQTEAARRKTAVTQIRNIESAIALYELDNGTFPTTEEGLQALVEQPANAKNWREGGYLEKGKVPKDPWKNPYVYVSPGAHTQEYDLESYGADGVDGGDGNAADVESWNIE
jgi:general secretion pathway protein G